MDAVRKGTQHVIFIIKENRTYDQILGDLEIGNGDPDLTEFGEDITPNSAQSGANLRYARQLPGHGRSQL